MRPRLMRTTVPANGGPAWTRRNRPRLLEPLHRSSLLGRDRRDRARSRLPGNERAPRITRSLGLGLVLALPVLWIAIARLAEKRYLSRPPKRFLATALGFDAGGIVLVVASVLLIQSQSLDAASIFAAGGVLEGCGTLLLLVWFLLVWVAAPTADHMHAL